MNFDPEKRFSNLKTRARVLATVREFFAQKGFLEVETPVRIPAPLPEANINAQPSGDWYLQTSPESCCKRLLARGHDKIFTICRVFRQGERGDRHLPEFTMLEFYQAGADYHVGMDLCHGLVQEAARALDTWPGLTYQKQTIRLEKPWPRLTVAQAFSRYAKKDLRQSLMDDDFDRDTAFLLEPGLPGETPVFLTDYPREHGALARLSKEDPSVAERFELYAGGLELANGFSELDDPEEQARRFEEENRQRREQGKEAGPWPEKFLADLAHMGPATGVALGLDRLVMLLCDASSIGEVVAFTPEEL